MTLQDIDKNNIPQHVAIIMDGNGRWAQKQNKIRLFGHQNALTAVRSAVETASRCGVRYLTLYTFSTENWRRPIDEVSGLMDILARATLANRQLFFDNNVRLRVIGDLQRIPHYSRNVLQQCINDTAAHTGTTLILALSYSARWEVADALRRICRDAADGRLAPDDINEESLRPYLATAEYPDPDLLIRTGGEYRLSNFLLWQSAYTEFYFTDLLWPDFRSEHFFDAIYDYQQRQRRFGKTGEQVKK